MAALWPVLRRDARTVARIGRGVLPDHGHGVVVQQVEPWAPAGAPRRAEPHAAALLP